jgi:hypothetical protein
VQLAQDGDERIVCCVHREVVEVARAPADAGSPLTASHLKASGPQQQRVQALRGVFALAPRAGERPDPAERLDVGRGAAGVLAGNR